MSIAFAAEVIQAGTSVVDTVFGQPVVLRNEALGEAKIPAGRVALIANYRAFVASNKGKKARGAGQAVLDLSAVSRLPCSELGALIERLEELEASMAEGIQAAEAIGAG
jgi:hypothetical protein